MFESANAQKLSPRSILASIAAHACGIMLLGLISFPQVRPIAHGGATFLIVRAVERPVLQTRVKPLQARAKTKPSRKFVPPIPPGPRTSSRLPPLADPGPMAVDTRPLKMPEVPVEAPTVLEVPRNAEGFGVATIVARNSSPKPASETGAFSAAAASDGGGRQGAITRASGFAAAEASEAPRPNAFVAATAGFGTAIVAEPVRSSSRPPSASALSTPVEILEKPRPGYTEEARRMAIEGEVLIEVLFSASGQARVSRVLRGLGHGLDEQAVDAAERIRFRPAMRGGAPVDSSAVVHIVFQLAY